MMPDKIIRSDGSLAEPKEMRPPAELQTPLHTSIAGELITITPEHWSEITLELVRKRIPSAGRAASEGVSHTIRSPDGDEVVLPSGRLLEHTRELDLAFSRHGARWRTAKYRVTVGDDSWSWNVAFTYDNKDDSG